MNKFFGQKYKENIIYNQKALNDYHLALHNLLNAIQKGNSFDKERLFLMKELVESMQTTIMDLQKLQIKKMVIGDKSYTSFFLQKDLSLFSSPKNIGNDQNSPSPKISIKNNTPSPPPRLFIDKKEKKDN